MKPVPTRRSAVAAAAVVAGLGLAGTLLVPHSPAELRENVAELGGFAPVLFVVAGALLSAALFPFPVVGACAGLAFGTAVGTSLTVASTTLGAALAFAIARRFGTSFVVGVPSSRIAKLLAAVERGGFGAVLLLRVAPGLPRGVVSYTLGVTRVSATAFVAATALGSAPRAFAYASLGSAAALSNFESPEVIVAIGMLGAMAVLGGLLALLERRG
jgi:uncharacterized membrane protein YdjX (TVP38/TMEM64 family)